jgi:hypothetical protein
VTGRYPTFAGLFARSLIVRNLQTCGALLVFGLLLSGNKNSLTTDSVIKPTTSLAAPCSLYAAPSGSDRNSGNSSTSPKTFFGAAAFTQPGSVVCLLGGTYRLSSAFRPPNSGTPSAWIVYRNYGDALVTFVWIGAADAAPMLDINGGGFPSKLSYLEFRGLNLDGRGKAGDGFFCRGSHHLRFIGNRISNTGGSGIGAIKCDYVMIDHNIIDHNGYVPSDAGANAKYYSWTSGVSLNSNQWYDSYTGFHNIISNNIVTGEVDESSKHSDGNGIILDLSDRTYNYSSANTPPALIINNVVYGNGGRCIAAYIVSNFWIVNNTCYKNNWDSSIDRAGNIDVNNSHDGYVINNITIPWSAASPCYHEENLTKAIHYYRNMCFRGSENTNVSDPAQIIQADPIFIDPPYLEPRDNAQRHETLAPTAIGDGLMLRPSSPALRKGIDPAILPNVSEAIIADLRKYAYADVKGTPRSQAEAPDLGAYQHNAVY